MTIDGKKIAEEIIAELGKKPRPDNFLAAISVGENAESASFLKQKEKVAGKLGIDFKIYELPADISEEKLREEISKIAGNPRCGGLILQLPLPKHLDRDEVVKAIPPEKDVDNLTGKAVVLAPAILVVEEIIRNSKLEIRNSRVAVVGLGSLVGKPISKWLEGKCAELNSLDISDNLETLKRADLVISGVGQTHLINPGMLKDGAIVIDFGYDSKNGKLSGDFDANSTTYNLSPITYTPTPGGTGPILVAKIFENFYALNARS